MRSMILWVFCAVCMSATVVLSEEYLDDLDLPPIPTIPEEMEVYTDAYAEQDTAQPERISGVEQRRGCVE